MVFKNTKIKNFRGIKALQIDDFSRVNLFVGKNNCGKTSVLEALFLLSGFSNAQLSWNINFFRDYDIKSEKDLLFLFYGMDFNNHIELESRMYDDNYRILEITDLPQDNILLDKGNIPTSSNKEEIVSGGLSMSYKYLGEDKKEKEGRSSLLFSQDKDGKGKRLETQKNTKDFEEPIRGAFINSKFAFQIAVEHLSKVIKNKEEGDILKVLQLIDPRIKDLMVIRNTVYVDIGLAQRIPINMLGDGIRKILAILTTMYDRKGGVVFIDEIDNGLHYLSLCTLWNAIFKTAEMFDVQIFATTHNIESLKSITQVLSEKEGEQYQKDITCYTLARFDDDSMKAYAYPHQKLQYVIDQEIEIR